MSMQPTSITQVPLVRSLGLSLAALLLGACASHGGQRATPPDSVADAEPTNFPDPRKATLKEGLFVDVDNLRLFARGMSKRQLYALLGTPHFGEGMWGVHECQFKVDFDGKGIAQAAHWKPQACAAVLDPPRPPAPPAPAPAPMPSEPLRLAADAMFAFDSAVLTPEGRRNVDTLLQQVRDASRVQAIQVIGYTDRIGSDRYNLVLSQRRAEAVRDALIAGGVPAGAIIAEGRGKADPLVQCAQAQRKALIVCLAPNRRVELSGKALPR